ncbi:endonuclease 4 [Candidatus Methanobinarius endosymbioticus]|uniref:Endonuclease 4 n=1 Tax=Candidatus Methanobinarius endosymbioticus TaxID=2006182 RepID=A0A366M9S6_9EURY|nr:endonuclease 4 [Candidatus Methanobinarius endosymbioticus]
MKIGVSSSSCMGKNIQESLEFAESINIEYFEILNEYPNDIIDIELMNSYNLKYTIHSPITDLNLASLNKSMKKASINEVKMSIDLANKLDSNIVVVHPSGFTLLGYPCEEKILSKCKDSMKKCGDYGKENEVMVTIENMSNIEGVLYQNIDKLNELLIELDMYMTLDVGHACTAGFQEKDLFFESIKHVHLADNFHDNDLHLGLGEGNINFKEVFEIFKKNKYDGKYVIEVIDKKSVLNSLDYLNKI